MKINRPIHWIQLGITYSRQYFIKYIIVYGNINTGDVEINSAYVYQKNIRMIYMRGLDLKIWNIKSWLQIRAYWMRIFLVKTYHMLEIRTRFNEISILLTRFLIKPRRFCLVCPITGGYWTLWLTLLGYWQRKSFLIKPRRLCLVCPITGGYWPLWLVVLGYWKKKTIF